MRLRAVTLLLLVSFSLAVVQGSEELLVVQGEPKQSHIARSSIQHAVLQCWLSQMLNSSSTTVLRMGCTVLCSAHCPTCSS
jgi:hypothetical protein